MASRMMALAVRTSPKGAPWAACRMHSTNSQADTLARLGNRDVVGYGWNGEPIYADRPDYPMPAIRFKENTPDVLVSLKTNWFLIEIIIFLFLGFEREGEGRLEEDVRG
jgi:hypothetical protein